MPRPRPDERSLSPTELSSLGGNIDSTTAVAEVTRRLLKLFTTGDLAPGDRLPPERQLASFLNVGRSAVREALAALELLGVVDVRAGSGTYLRGQASELLPQTLSWGMMIGAPKTRELIEVRYGLEVQAARLAAEQASKTLVAELEEQLALMESSKDDFPDFVAADMRFHQAIAHACNSALLEDLLQTVRSLIRVWVERALNDSQHAALTCSEHRAVLEAIRAGDSTSAAATMSAHMDSAKGRLLGSIDATSAA